MSNTEPKSAARLQQTLRFAGWPVLCGLLLAISLVQYQQLRRLGSLPSAGAGPVLSFAEAIRAAGPSVVSISAIRTQVSSDGGDDNSSSGSNNNVGNLYLEEPTSLGSGVIMRADGYILTNIHVVDSLAIQVGRLVIDTFTMEVTLQDGRSVPAALVALDRANDLAVLHINLDDLAPINMGNERALQVGDVVFAIGYPRNIGQSVTQGIVSAIYYNPDGSVSVIQTDAAIQSGNSGGALVDARGRLVGISSSIYSESGGFEGIGFATPASLAMDIMEHKVEQTIAINSGYLGVLTGEPLTPESSEFFFGSDDIRGMMVESVDAGGAARRAGIRPGDVITQVNGKPVTDGQNIIQEIRNKKPGDTIAIEVYRNGQTLTLPTILGYGQAVIYEL